MLRDLAGKARMFSSPVAECRKKDVNRSGWIGPCLVMPRRFPPPWSVDNPDMKLGQDGYNGSAYADGHPLAYGGFDGRGLINKTPLDPLMSHSGGPHGPNHWAVRHSGASRRYCLGGRLYLGAAWSIEEMKNRLGVTGAQRRTYSPAMRVLCPG